jgi:hypothetical protein
MWKVGILYRLAGFIEHILAGQNYGLKILGNSGKVTRLQSGEEPVTPMI